MKSGDFSTRRCLKWSSRGPICIKRGSLKWDTDSSRSFALAWNNNCPSSVLGMCAAYQKSRNSSR